VNRRVIRRGGPLGSQLAGYLRIGASFLAPLRPSGSAVAAVMLVAALVVLAVVYVATQHTAVLDINGTVMRHRTHERSAEGVLREVGIQLAEEDTLRAPAEDALEQGAPIVIRIARPVAMVHDGSVARARTQSRVLADVVDELGVEVSPNDVLYVAGAVRSLDDELPQPSTRLELRPKALVEALRRPVQLAVQRAVPLTVQDGALPMTFHTTARTVGEALFDRGFVIYQGDRVFPGLDAEITPGLSVTIERSKPIVLTLEGQRRALRTRAKTVAGLLETEGVSLGPKDYVLPDPETPITRDLEVDVVSVYDEYYIEEIPIPYDVIWVGDPELEIDQEEVTHWGEEGAKRRRIRVHYENNREMYRVEEEEWIARAPQDRTYSYGTKIVLRDLETPSGTVTYWRKIRMLATSYNAPTAGVSPSSSYYGYTRLGWRARKGIVAVDPDIIKLGSEVYVPGYGRATAADTGGAIQNRRIDLCYDDDNLVLWHKWVDVYLLAPAPPARDIVYRLPDQPTERG
jgi:uncharacterized protein YabE (DUF348 family)